ncbi:MAG TPA: hypothetical protein VG817_06765 [Gemmatimonadales bacterium]|nr:hypothetical protein [Gemmatimonadales bacterium]
MRYARLVLLLVVLLCVTAISGDDGARLAEADARPRHPRGWSSEYMVDSRSGLPAGNP